VRPVLSSSRVTMLDAAMTSNEPPPASAVALVASKERNPEESMYPTAPKSTCTVR